MMNGESLYAYLCVESIFFNTTVSVGFSFISDQFEILKCIWQVTRWPLEYQNVSVC